MDTTEQIYQLVKQWCSALDQHRASEALRQIAIFTNCISDLPDQLTEKQEKCVIEYLQENYPNAYLLAIGKFWVGHPAAVWGTKTAKVKLPASKRSSANRPVSKYI